MKREENDRRLSATGSKLEAELVKSSTPPPADPLHSREDYDESEEMTGSPWLLVSSVLMVMCGIVCVAALIGGIMLLLNFLA